MRLELVMVVLVILVGLTIGWVFGVCDLGLEGWDTNGLARGGRRPGGLDRVFVERRDVLPATEVEDFWVDLEADRDFGE